MPTCLVLTTFSDSGLSTKVAVEESLRAVGVRTLHPSDMSPQTPLSTTIADLLRSSDCVVADVSEGNANILFEIGMAAGLGVPIVLILDETREVALPPTSAVVVRYKNQAESRGEFPTQLARAVMDLTTQKAGAESLTEARNKTNQYISDAAFSGLNAESLDDRQLMELFVEPPYFSLLQDTSPAVMVGTRGSGKTMVLQALRLTYQIRRTQGPLGIYVNFNDLRYLGIEERAFLSLAQMVAYLNLMFLRALLWEIEIATREGWLSSKEQSDSTSGILKLFSRTAKDIKPVSLLDKVVGWIQQIRSGKTLDALTERVVTDKSFLDSLTKVLVNEVTSLQRRRIVFLLDDYASDWLPASCIETINDILLTRSSSCSFKIATIPGRVNFLLPQGRRADIGDDFTLIDMEFDDIQNIGASYIERILDVRLKKAGGSLSAAELLEPGLQRSNAGIKYLARFCSGNCRSAIEVFALMIKQVPFLDHRIPVAIQTRAMTEYSQRRLHVLAESQWGTYVTGFLTQWMRGVKNRSTKDNKERVLAGFQISADAAYSSEVNQRLSWLIRSEVIQRKRLRSRPGLHDHYEINPLFRHAFGVPIVNRDYLILGTNDLSHFLEDPYAYLDR